MDVGVLDQRFSLPSRIQRRAHNVYLIYSTHIQYVNIDDEKEKEIALRRKRLG